MCPLFKIKNQFLGFLNFSREEFESIDLFIKIILIDWYLNFSILYKAKKYMKIFIKIYRRTILKKRLNRTKLEEVIFSLGFAVI